MQTQVSILVKNGSLYTRAKSSLFWFISIFKKTSVEVFLDSENNKMVLKAQKEPYLIDVDPGQHQILFSDPKAKSKARSNALTGALLGAAFMGAGGGSMLGGAAMGYESASGSSTKNDVVSFVLNEGDMLKLSAKPKSNGRVKVKILKD